MNISLTKKEIDVLMAALISYEDALIQNHSDHFMTIKNNIDSLDTKLIEAAQRLRLTKEEGQN